MFFRESSVFSHKILYLAPSKNKTDWGRKVSKCLKTDSCHVSTKAVSYALEFTDPNEVGNAFCLSRPSFLQWGVVRCIFKRSYYTYIYGIYGNPLWKPFLNFNKVTMPYPAFLQTTNSHQLFFCTCDTMQWMMCRPSPALHLEHLHQTAPFVIEERPPMKPNQAPTPSGSNGGYPVEWFVGSFQGCWEVVQILDGKAKSFGCPQ